jgi:hypothetical protein
MKNLVSIVLTLIIYCIYSFLLTTKIIYSSFHLGNNSDLLYPFLFLRDFFNNYSSLNQWYLPPANAFFPDIFLLAFLYKLPIETSMFYYVLIQLLMIHYLFYFYNKTKSYSNLLSSIISISCVTFIFIIFGNHKDLITIFLPGYHSTIYLFGGYIWIKKDEIKFNFKLLIISLLLGFSDPFIIIQVLLPLFLFFLIINNISQLKIIVKLILITLLGKYIQSILLAFSFLKIPDIPVFKTFILLFKQNLIFKNLHISLQLMLKDLIYDPFIFIVLIFFTTLLINFKSKNNISKPIFVSYTLSIIINYLFQGSFGLWMGSRYIWFFYLIPIIFLNDRINRFIRIYFSKKTNLNFLKLDHTIVLNTLLIIYLTFLIFFITSIKNNLLMITSEKLNLLSIHETSNYYNFLPKKMICLREIQMKYNLIHGISDYWNAKYIHFFSNRELNLYQSDSQFNPYHWIYNSKFYFESIGTKKTTFIITNSIDESYIKQKVGLPLIIENCEPWNIWIYEHPFEF